MSFAFARCKKLNMSGLVAAERHARRQDNSKHVDRSRTHLNPVEGYAGVDDPLAIRDAYKARKKDTGASERKGVAVAVHMLLGVSPDWVAAAGDVHDPHNPRNKALFDSAKSFMEERFGPGSVIHVRLDVDEAGSGVVDVIAVPVTTYTQRGKTKTRVSANAGLEAAFGKGLNYRQMQDAWAEHCQQTLDTAIERGKPREETGRDHVDHSIYRPMMERAAAEAVALKAKVVKETRADLTDEWEKAGLFGRREKAIEAARDAAYVEGQDSMRPWAEKKAGKVKARADKEKEAALKRKDEEWRGKVNALENEVEAVRDHLRGIAEERDALATEVDALRDENGKLKEQVSLLRRVVDFVREKAPDRVRKLIDALTREQAPAPPSAASEASRGAAPEGRAQGGMNDQNKKDPRPF